jgi:hypothetical protein
MLFHDEAAGVGPDLSGDLADFFEIEDRELLCGGVLIAGMIDPEEPVGGLSRDARIVVIAYATLLSVPSTLGRMVLPGWHFLVAPALGCK